MTKFSIIILFLLLFHFANGQRRHIVFEATFDSLSVGNGFDSVSQCGNTIQLSDSVKRSGSKSVRFSLTAADTNTCNDLRSQMMKSSGSTNHQAWYGFSVYFSSVYPDKYDGVESFFQVYRDSSEYMPPLVLNYNGFNKGHNAWPSGKYITVVQSLVSPDSVVSESAYTQYHYPIGVIEFDKWIDVVMNIKWSNDTTGYIRIWVNKDLAFIHSGVNNYTSNHFRTGIDKMDWRRGWNISSTGHRVIYFDELRVGDSLAQFSDVWPGKLIDLPLRNQPEVRAGKKESTPFTMVNPVRNDIIQFQIPSTRRQKMSYELMDISGRVLMRGNLSLENGYNYREINSKHLVSGMYFFALQSQSGLTIKKIIK